jgi:TonB family protein
MRYTTLVLMSILFSTSAAAATFESRSEHYALNVTNSAIAAKVVVTDLDSNSPVISEEIPWTPGQPSKIVRDIGDLRFSVRLTRGLETMTANLEVDRGDMEIDLIRTEWILSPRRTHYPVGGTINGAFRVGGDVHAPQVVHRVEPIYPEEARRNHISGIVIVQTTVDAAGHVTDAIPLKGEPELIAAAIDAVKQWTFEPGTKAGKPVPVVFNLTVNFLLDTTPSQPPVPY